MPTKIQWWDLKKSKQKFGKSNSNWRGGKTISSHGYVLVRVGIKHHLADVRGYAYEHRVIAEQKIGRKLKQGEIVHHKDKNKQTTHLRILK